MFQRYFNLWKRASFGKEKVGRHYLSQLCHHYHHRHHLMIIWQALRSMTRCCSKVGWKWSEKCRKNEISLIWCISTTNNVKSCKKFNETAQTVNFNYFSLISCENGPKLCKHNFFQIKSKWSHASFPIKKKLRQTYLLGFEYKSEYTKHKNIVRTQKELFKSVDPQPFINSCGAAFFSPLTLSAVN